MSKKSKEGSKGTIEYFAENKTSSLINGKKYIREEYIIKGDKGLTIKFFLKEGDKSQKIIIKDNADKFDLMESTDGKQEEKKTITKEELIKFVKGNKELKFVQEFLNEMKGGKKRKTSRKKSRKSKSRKH